MWADLSVTAIRDELGEFRNFFSQLVDTTDKVRIQEHLMESEQRYRILAENASNVVFQANLDGAVGWISDSAKDLIGWRSDGLIGTVFANLLHPADAAVLQEGRDKAAAGEPWLMEFRVRSRGSTFRWISASLRPIFDVDGKLIGRVGGWRDIHARVQAREALAASERRFQLAMDSAPTGMALVGLLRGEAGKPLSFVSQFVDITEAKQSRDELSFLATHDSMTEFLNRRELLNRLDQLATHKPRTGTRTALLYIDIDDFKEVDDAYGHGGGDAVIVAAAARIAQQVRTDDPIARIGGEAFRPRLGSHLLTRARPRQPSRRGRLTPTLVASRQVLDNEVDYRA